MAKKETVQMAMDWIYSDDGLQRHRVKENGMVETESVPQGETLTQQQYIEDTDVNVIMARFMKTGAMPTTVAPMIEGDFSQLPDYQEALHTVMKAEQMFMEIPATTRLRFENNPQKLMDFLADESNREESYTLGLRERPQVQVEDPVVAELKELRKQVSKKGKEL